MEKLKSIYASAYSAAVTVAIIVAVTIGAELSAGFKSWLAGFTGHHWVTKCLLSLIVFAAFYFVFHLSTSQDDRLVKNARRALILLQISIILGFIAILGFYIYHFLVK